MSDYISYNHLLPNLSYIHYIDKLNEQTPELIIVGDLNYNHLKIYSNSIVQDYYNMIDNP